MRRVGMHVFDGLRPFQSRAGFSTSGRGASSTCVPHAGAWERGSRLDRLSGIVADPCVVAHDLHSAKLAFFRRSWVNLLDTA
jgi:hypothetical protein